MNVHGYLVRSDTGMCFIVLLDEYDRHNVQEVSNSNWPKSIKIDGYFSKASNKVGDAFYLSDREVNLIVVDKPIDEAIKLMQTHILLHSVQ